MSREDAVWVQRYLVRTATRATSFGAFLRRFLSEPAREPADPDNMFSNALNMVRRQVIPPVEKPTKVRTPWTTDVLFSVSATVLIPLFARTPRSMALLDAAGPVPSDQVGRVSNITAELHTLAVGLQWIAKNARQGEVVLVCCDSEYARNMAGGLWKPRANWKAVSKAKSACSLAEVGPRGQ